MFEAVVGQDAITRTLQQRARRRAVSPTRISSPGRGESVRRPPRACWPGRSCAWRGPAPSHAGRCDACRDTATVDVIEIDGASNRGIEEIRTLRENVKYAPTRGRYKVYIIDEVHQLTEAAFNALLKTLEEPPSPRGLRPGHHGSARHPGHRALARAALRLPPHGPRRAGAARSSASSIEEKIPFDPAALPAARARGLRIAARRALAARHRHRLRRRAPGGRHRRRLYSAPRRPPR